MIIREDMLELTRRMTLKRHCFDRIAGAYFDSDGFIDGTFNLHFLKLSAPEMTSKLKVFKQVAFSDTNDELKEYPYSSGAGKQKEMHRLLAAMQSCGLKNDALCDMLYEMLSDSFPARRSDSALLLCHGVYDVPRKASDKERLWESEDIYDFIIGAFCPLLEEYEPDLPECGFIYPAFSGRLGDPDHILLYQSRRAGAPDWLAGFLHI